MESITCITPSLPEREEFRGQCIRYVERFRRFNPHRRIEHIVEVGGTLSSLLKKMLPKVDTDFVAIIEDDDVYAADYLEYQIANINHYGISVMGMTPTVYYHLKWSAYTEITHDNRASLFTIAGKTNVIRPVLMPIVSEAEEVPFIDYRLCQDLGDGRSGCIPHFNKAIGIKHNIIGISSGKGHEWGEDRFETKDNGLKFLQNACGEEFIEFYKNMAESL